MISPIYYRIRHSRSSANRVRVTPTAASDGKTISNLYILSGLPAVTGFSCICVVGDLDNLKSRHCGRCKGVKKVFVTRENIIALINARRDQCIR